MPPQNGKEATIVPLLKPQKPTDSPSSCKPISLTNSCCKLKERMVMPTITDSPLDRKPANFNDCLTPTS
ncbi:hypothetical protein CDAR_554671 [Caerostris darwini]|uniref:Uncharacterized protein n=1 Tax=Caerostris darwini TaxID=1538125 RepID=A0AAV4TUI6_9ARAC|nr:hypothetical protein CDAR_554671 [Caerostris darwini]